MMCIKFSNVPARANPNFTLAVTKISWETDAHLEKTVQAGQLEEEHGVDHHVQGEHYQRLF